MKNKLMLISVCCILALLISGCSPVIKELRKVEWVVLSGEAASLASKKAPVKKKVTAQQPARRAVSGVAMKQVPGFRVQIAKLEDEESARTMAKACEDLIHGIKSYVVQDGSEWKVSMGDCITKDEAQQLRDKLIKLGYAECWIVSAVVNTIDKDTGKTIKPVAGEIIVDETDASCTFNGNWVTGTYPGGYNDTYKYIAKGSGLNTVVWTPNIANAGVYKVYAWWIAGQNRSAAVTYTIKHVQGNTVVKMSQRDGNRQWNLLGTFEFSKGASNSVTLSDNVIDDGMIVLADAIRITKERTGISSESASKSGSAVSGYPSALINDFRVCVAKGQASVGLNCKSETDIIDKKGKTVATAKALDLCTLKIKGQTVETKPVYRVVVSAYSDKKDADNESKNIKKLVKVPVYVVYELPWYKIQVGDFVTEDAAENTKQVLSANYSEARIQPFVPKPKTKPQLEVFIEGKSAGVFDELVWVRPKKEGGSTGFAGKSYRGDIAVKTANDGLLMVINCMKLDTFVSGIVAAEINVELPLEALKSQAVAVRSRILSYIPRYSTEDYDLYSESYKGAKETAQVQSAAEATKGEVMVYKDGLAYPDYTVCCGGYTEDAQNVSGNKCEYMVSVPCFASNTNTEFTLPPGTSEAGITKWLTEKPVAYCSGSTKYYRWEKMFTNTELETLIKKSYSGIGTLTDIKLGDRTPAGRVKWIEIVGTDKTERIENQDKICDVFGGKTEFYSNEFILVKDKNAQGENTYKFVGGGCGSGTGMCQDGAAGMANEGKTYKDIILQYYPGTEIKKVY